MPESDKENTTENAGKYSRIKYTLAIIDTVYLFILIVFFLRQGISAMLAGLLHSAITPQFLVFPSYLLAVFLLYYILQFPLNFYGSFIVEHKFCLSKQNFQNWFLDQVKAGIVSYIISIIIFGAFYLILKYNPSNWWIIVSLFWIFFSVIMAKLAPVIIIPLFFKYKPLSDDALRLRIKALADKMKVKIMDVFEIDFSKKTLKANAAFAGWGNTRRVILADTLKDKYTHDEIEVILAHEFAHYQMKHLLKLLLINSLTTLTVFYLMFITNNAVLRGFGLSSLGDIAAFPLIILYFMAFGLIMQPLSNYISRVFERKADMSALRITGLKEAFISMMDKLSSQNLSDRNPHPLIKFFFFDHPSTNERIEMAREYGKD